MKGDINDTMCVCARRAVCILFSDPHHSSVRSTLGIVDKEMGSETSLGVSQTQIRLGLSLSASTHCALTLSLICLEDSDYLQGVVDTSQVYFFMEFIIRNFSWVEFYPTMVYRSPSSPWE